MQKKQLNYIKKKKKKKIHTLNAISFVITNWLPHEKPIEDLFSPTLSIAFRQSHKSNS
jgi:hypothetical protein